MKSFISLLFLFLLSYGEAAVIETTTIRDALPYIDATTWVLIDLDNTLYEGKQALGHTEWFYDQAHALMRNEGMTLEEATRACYPEWIEVQKICPVKCVEEIFIPTLKELRNRNIVIMGLTHRQPSIADSTIRQIASLDWNFAHSAPTHHCFSVPSETPTLYTNGVLFTGEYNKKGEIFVRFLSLIEQKPKKILFIDDKLNHVEEVGRAVEKLGIEYTGIHFTAIQYAEKVYWPEIAEFQKKFLQKIMSNEAALLLMEFNLE
jgi:hypothetical protein